MALVKQITRTLVSPGVAAVPARPALPRRLVGPPPPIGYAYSLPVPHPDAVGGWEVFSKVGGQNTDVVFTPWNPPIWSYPPLQDFTRPGSRFGYVKIDPIKGPIPAAAVPFPPGALLFCEYRYKGEIKTAVGPLSAFMYLRDILNTDEDLARHFSWVLRGTFHTAIKNTSDLLHPVASGIEPVFFRGSTLDNGFPIGADIKPQTGVLYGVNGEEYETSWAGGGSKSTPVGLVCRGGNLPQGTKLKCAGRIIILPGTPAVPARPGKRPQWHVNNHVGWNSGANSRSRLDGDLEASFQLNVKGAACIGFAAAGTVVNGDFKKLSHALYCDADPTGRMQVRPIEYGNAVATPVPVASTTRLHIRRVNGVVSYHVGTQEIYRSNLPSGGSLQLTTALYRGGDMVY